MNEGGIEMKELNKGIKYSYLGFVVCSLITVIVASYIYIGTAIAGIIGVSGLFSIIGWYLSSSKSDRIPENMLVVYLFTVMGMLLQNIEEWTFGFSSSAIFGNHIYFALYSIGLAALFVFGAMGLTYKHSFGIFMTWFIFTWAIIQGGAHYVYPIISGAKFYYFPGQVMSLILILLGGYGIKKLLSCTNELKGVVRDEKK